MPNTSKLALKNYCLRRLELQAEELQVALDEIHSSLEEETKSSVGDKYETARAQLQIEQKRLDQQMDHIVKQHKALHDVNHESHRTIDEGSVVMLTLGDKSLNIYIAVALGSVTFNEKNWQVISEISPLAQALKGKKSGDSFPFQGKMCSIKEVG